MIEFINALEKKMVTVISIMRDEKKLFMVFSRLVILLENP